MAAVVIDEQFMKEKKPNWTELPAFREKKTADKLNALKGDATALQKKDYFVGDPELFQACLDALGVDKPEAAQWMVTFVYDMLREDNSTFDVFEDILHKSSKQKDAFLISLTTIMVKHNADRYVADRCAWILTAVIGNSPKVFTDKEVQSVVGKFEGQTTCTELGILEALCNLLKAGDFRPLVWGMPGVEARVMQISPEKPALLYKSIFALWMLSFAKEGTLRLNSGVCIKKIREALVNSRSEKVVRLSLTVLRNFLSNKSFTEEVVELGVLEVVQQLEYEKWRDSDLYDDIRDMVSLIATKVQEMSNFDRYERELNENRLRWGFIHSSKFWAENHLKFEQNDFRALKKLKELVNSTDPETQAVACHDIGEFVTMHPLGKKTISKYGLKEMVMQLMTSTQPELKDVRREALLCCQKIMLNKWQDVEGPSA